MTTKSHPAPVPAPALIVHKPGFLDKGRAETVHEILQALLPWTTFAPSPKSRKVWRWDRPIGDPAIDGIFTELIYELEKSCRDNGSPVTVEGGIFCNLYRDGDDYCPYHKDQYGCDVWTLSLGSTRDFLVKKDGTGTRADSWTLKSGDMYFMSKNLHKDHRHSIPVRKGRPGSRISIVFFTRPGPGQV